MPVGELPGLTEALRAPREIAWRAGDLFRRLAAGEMRLTFDRAFPLSRAAQAHAALEGRRTTGKVLLTPP